MKNWLLGIYFEITVRLKRRKLEQQLAAELRPYSLDKSHGIYQDDTERKYAEGIYRVKNKINSMVNVKSKEEYEQVLDQIKELISLSTEETPGQAALRKTLQSLCALPEKNKKEMIDERIEHYKELHEYKEQRALMKSIRQARKDNKKELALELEKEWRGKYGKVRNSRGR